MHIAVCMHCGQCTPPLQHYRRHITTAAAHAAAANPAGLHCAVWLHICPQDESAILRGPDLLWKLSPNFLDVRVVHTPEGHNGLQHNGHVHCAH